LPPAVDSTCGGFGPPSPLRPPQQVMRLARLGAFHQTRLSFVRSLVRKIARPPWRIAPPQLSLDEHGFGRAVYRVRGARGDYSFIAFANPLSAGERSDRVIAERWDTAFVLAAGGVDEAGIARLARNIPLQEAGRCTAGELVLSRANKSVRLFEHVAASLAAGRQPEVDKIAPVGYLLRTTAVYGNGKFGLADFARVCGGDFDAPFSAQMFTVYMARQFSFDLVEHIARHRNRRKFTPLAPAVKRFFGVGNATGLGMAPFLVHHPRLIGRWIYHRERALAQVRGRRPEPARLARFAGLLERALIHTAEITVEDAAQTKRNQELCADLRKFEAEFFGGGEAGKNFPSWQRALRWSEDNAGLEAQEMLVSLLLEAYPELNEMENAMGGDERLAAAPAMPLRELKQLLERNYGFALRCDFGDPRQSAVFWYYSAEKEEPRLGRRGHEPGAEREMAVDIARRAAALHDCLARLPAAELDGAVGDFLLRRPDLRGIVRRVQGLADCPYGEIHDNLVAEGCRPMDVLRCKLSLFGASKFDPKSDLWTRITLFQGAPPVAELGRGDADDWAFPCKPAP